MPDVFEALGAAHREVEQMLDRMLYLIGGQAEPTAELLEQGGSLAAALISAVSRHEAAEEEYFWPTAKEKAADGEPLAAGGAGQETEVREMLTELDGMTPSDPQFIPLMIRFNRAARDHIAYEEQQVWPGLRAALTADDRPAGRGTRRGSKGRAGPDASALPARPDAAEGRGGGRRAAIGSFRGSQAEAVSPAGPVGRWHSFARRRWSSPFA